MNSDLRKLLVAQMCKYMADANWYLSISALCKSHSLNGLASWALKRYEKSSIMALKVFQHLTARNEMVEIEAIPGPAPLASNPPTIIEVPKLVIEATTKITDGNIAQLENIGIFALKQKDFRISMVIQRLLDMATNEQSENRLMAAQAELPPTHAMYIGQITPVETNA